MKTMLAVGIVVLYVILIISVVILIAFLFKKNRDWNDVNEASNFVLLQCLAILPLTMLYIEFDKVFMSS